MKKGCDTVKWNSQGDVCEKAIPTPGASGRMAFIKGAGSRNFTDRPPRQIGFERNSIYLEKVFRYFSRSGEKFHSLEGPAVPKKHAQLIRTAGCFWHSWDTAPGIPCSQNLLDWRLKSEGLNWKTSNQDMADVKGEVYIRKKWKGEVNTGVHIDLRFDFSLLETL